MKRRFRETGVFKILIAAAVFLMPGGMLDAQQWYWSYDPHGRTLGDVIIKNPTDIQVCGGITTYGNGENVFRSVNSGLDWDFISEASGRAFNNSIAFSDSLHGFTVGNRGYMMTTTDGGTNWNFDSSAVSDDLHKILFVNARIGYIAGGNPATAMHSILKTTNGGQTWNIIYNQAGWVLKSMAFTDSLHGVAVGDTGTILITTNGGNTWNSVTPPVIRNFQAVTFTTADTGFIVGGDSANRTLLKTVDGGQNWSVIIDEPGSVLNAITFLNPMKGYMAGDSAYLYKTIDGGQNWTQEFVPNNFYRRFTAINFYNDSLGMVVGYDGYNYVYAVSALPAAITGPAAVADTSDVSFYGQVNTHGYPGDYYFLCSPYASFNQFFPVYVHPVLNSTTPTPVSGGQSGLQPNQTYYYCVVGGTLAGQVYGDTLTFFTGAPFSTYHTDYANVINDTSVVLYGYVKTGNGDSTQVYFEYGTTPNLGSTVAALPALIHDTAGHVVTDTLNNLVAETYYYYRVKAVTNAGIFMGDIRSFYNGVFTGNAQTFNASGITDNTATLNGQVSGLNRAANISFEYGTTPLFGNEITAVPGSVSDMLSHSVAANLTGLNTGTLYYYRVKAHNNVGDILGNTQAFVALTPTFTILQTGAAQSTSTTSAQLTGVVKNAGNTHTAISFLYGTTPTLLSNNVIALPDSVTDTVVHYPVANLTGLTPNSIYYYCIKGVNANTGYVMYGDTMQAYTGAPEIPNWDFQYWDTSMIKLPYGWNVANSNVARVPGHTGNYALKLWGTGLSILGVPGDGPFTGGQALHARPDSISFYADYSVISGDSALILVIMYSGQNIIVQQFYLLGGNTGGTFKKFTFPISYNSTDTPDSLVLGVASSNLFVGYNPNSTNNYFTIDDMGFVPNTPSIYNGDFETWIDYRTEWPLGWVKPQYIFIDTTAGAERAVSRTFYNPPGDYALQLSNILYQGAIAGVDFTATSGMFDANQTGFPVSGRHAALNGYYKYFPDNGDSLQIYIDMYKQGQNVGGSEFIAKDSVTSFTPFSLPINYNNGSDIPDSANIRIRAAHSNGPMGLSKVMIDKLSFDGFYADVKGVNLADDAERYSLKIYPNPNTGLLHVQLQADNNEQQFDVHVYDINGKLMSSVQHLNVNSQYTINVEPFAAGMYFMNITCNGKLTAHAKFIKQ